MRPCVLLLAMALAPYGPRALAQSVATRDTAVVVPASQLAGAFSRSDTTPILDRMLSLQSVGGEYNVGVATVRRLRRGGVAPPDALSHTEVTEIYYIVSGRAVMVTGGAIVDAVPLSPTGTVVRRLIGPSLRGVGIHGGTERTVGPGDVVVIPAGTPHGFVRQNDDELRYVVMRIDARRVLESP